ncbi:MAG TPA: stage III sporulation protein AF [Symbiobacteriaceae bacterium]|nr:stage III sporulation protein AF [Symbiobacteriaceae bacterium]
MKEWVRGLVVLVLLASCLEMMLPMGSMKKYVKLTMGLMIVLATLRPVFGFLGQPVAVTAALFDEKPQTGLPTISEIMAKAAEFRQKNQALAAGEVKNGLAAEAARAARSVAGVADAEAEVDLAEAGGEVTIKAVTVRVTPGAPGGVKPVEPVSPVGGGKVLPPARRQLTAAEQRLSEAVRLEVAQRLGLEGAAATHVRVVLEQTQGR